MRRTLAATLVSCLFLNPVSAAEPQLSERLPTAHSAIAALLDANGGRPPASGEQLWATLRKLGKFAQLPIPFSSVRISSGITAPRVVIAPVGGVLGQAEPTQVNFAGRLYIAANMERAAGADLPRVTSIEFISWNGARRAFDFGFIEKMGTDSPRIEVVEGGKCFSCHKNRGPILGVNPWSNTTNDDNLRFAVAHTLKIGGIKLPETGPFAAALRPKGKLDARIDRVDGMALAIPEAPAVDSSVRAGAGLLERRETFQLLTRTPEGRRVLEVLMVAMMEPGVLDQYTPGVRSAIDTAGEKAFVKFAADWLEMRKTPKLSAIVNVDTTSLLYLSGVRPELKRPHWPDLISPLPPGIAQPNGTTWIGADTALVDQLGHQLARPNLNGTERRVLETRRQAALLEQVPQTQKEIQAYDVVRSAGTTSLASRFQPTNPRAFIRPPTIVPRRISEVVSAPLLADTIGVTDGDRRWLIQVLATAARSAGVKSPALAKEVFESKSFEDVMSGGPLPDREEFKDRFVEGLVEVMQTKHKISSYAAADRKEYSSGPRYDPKAVSEKEVLVTPTSACLRCHEVSKSGIASKFDIVPTLAFDPFDKTSRRDWLTTTDAKTRQHVLAKMIKRLATDQDMPPEDAPEHALYRVKDAASFAEVKKYLTAEYDRAKGK